MHNPSAVTMSRDSRISLINNVSGRRVNSKHFGNIGDRMTVMTQLLSNTRWPMAPRKNEPTFYLMEFITFNDEVLRYKEERPAEFNVPWITADWYTLDLIIRAHSPAEHKKDSGEVIKLKARTAIEILSVRHNPAYLSPPVTAYAY